MDKVILIPALAAAVILAAPSGACPDGRPDSNGAWANAEGRTIVPESEAPPGAMRIDLSGKWRFRRLGSSAWNDASVPGCVHADLLGADAIEDPFYACNEESLQWIENEDWEYERTFPCPSSFLEKMGQELVFEGLDTYADVYLNGALILSADNMFREWRTDCRGLLAGKDNTLRIVIHSPVKKGARLASALPFDLPGGHRVFSRKAAFHYGWDWGPRFVTSGIWRPVRLEGWESARIRDARFVVEKIGEKAAACSASLALEATAASEAVISVFVDGRRIAGRGPDGRKCGPAALSRGMNRFDFDFEITDPVLWWPNGMGGQRLYEVELVLMIDGNETDSITRRIGLRTVELVTERNEDGESFFFRINGRPLFMKGANYIPIDIFHGRTSPAGYESLVNKAAEANMNMLRVWGGGIYEDDIFYSFCDEHGILVWQDFMFACAMYPWDRPFIDNVRAEAECNLRRLSHHPCIALWCGNNEIDEAWHNWGWREAFGDSAADEIWEGYRALFHGLLPEAVEDLGCGVQYVPSSPRYGRGDPRSLSEGDCHYWGVWHDAEPFEVLEERTGRFMSEFGFQSLPSLKTILSFTPPGEARLDSPAMLCHQKHPRGTALISEYMAREYPVPADFEKFVYLSQILQARGIASGIEAQRRAFPHCMGSLYWQLNDCWPAVSWSSIEYNGICKALYYRAKDAFAPLLLSPVVSNGVVRVYIAQDGSGCGSPDDDPHELKLELMDFTGRKHGAWERVIAALPPAPAQFFEMPVEDLLKGSDPASVFFNCSLEHNGRLVSRKLLYFAEPRDLDLIPPSIEAKVEKCEEGYIVELSSETLAKDVFVSFGSETGNFSDNFFDLVPGEKKIIRCETSADLGDALRKLRIITLADTF